MTQSGWEDDGRCYVCGPHNAEGMKLAFTLSGETIETSFVAEKRHQGYRDVLHGGFLAMVMDEVMVLLPYRLYGTVTATAELSVKLARPVSVGSRVTVRAMFEGTAKPDQRRYRVRAECRMDDGTIVATAQGRCARVR